MQITKVTIGAGMTVPVADVPFSNVKPTVEVACDIGEMDDYDTVVGQLTELVHTTLVQHAKKLYELMRNAR